MSTRQFLKIFSLHLVLVLACATEPQDGAAIEDLTGGVDVDLRASQTELMDELSTDLQSRRVFGKKMKLGGFVKGIKQMWSQIRDARAGRIKKCKGHCNNDCLIKKFMLDANCTLTKHALQGIRRNVEFVRNATVPKWKIYSQFLDFPKLWTEKKGTKVLGTITCPCAHSDGKLVSATEAERKIMGAIAGMKLPLSVGVLGIPSFGLPTFRIPGSRMDPQWMVEQWAMQYGTRMLDLKYMYSTGLMMQCWSQHCKANDKKGSGSASGSALGKRLRQRFGSAFAATDIQEAWGGGVAC